MPDFFDKKSLARMQDSVKGERKRFSREPGLRYRGIPIQKENPLHFRNYNAEDSRHPGKNRPGDLCNVSGCRKPRSGKFAQYCSAHGKRLKRHGDPVDGFAVKKWVVRESVKVFRHLLKNHCTADERRQFESKISELSPTMKRPKVWLPKPADWSIDIVARQQSMVGHALLWHKPKAFVEYGDYSEPKKAIRQNIHCATTAVGMVGCDFVPISSPEFFEKRCRYLAGNILHNSMDRTWPDTGSHNGKIEFQLTDKARYWLGDDYVALSEQVYGKDFWDRELTLQSGRAMTFREFMRVTMNNIHRQYRVHKPVLTKAILKERK